MGSRRGHRGRGAAARTDHGPPDWAPGCLAGPKSGHIIGPPAQSSAPDRPYARRDETMKRRVSFLVASASILVLAVAFSWHARPAAAAQGSAPTVFMSTEAWYDETPPCVSLIDCSAAPAATPYPEDTLHVSVTAGQETARTYVAFYLPASNLTGGTLTLPLDTSSSDGSVAPDTADLTACVVTHSFKPVRGSLETPPPANCHVSSAAVYDAKHP